MSDALSHLATERIAAQDHYADVAERNEAFKRRFPCPECGSITGMEEWWSGDIARLNGLALMHYTFYANFNSPVLFTTCPVCNRAGRIPEGYTPVADPLQWAAEHPEHDYGH